MRKFVVSALTAIGLAAAAAPAAAEDLTVYVTYSDLDLGTAEGIETLAGRIASAVSSACARPESMRNLKAMVAWESCRSAATESAYSQLETTVELASL